MAEQWKVGVDGELVVLVAEGEGGTCEVRLKLDEADRFAESLDEAVRRVVWATEVREAEEAGKISGVDEDDGA
jgi:hypothetical protein